MRIPERLKTNNGVLKHIRKQSVRGLVPDELFDRPTQGFGVPVREWFADHLSARARQKRDGFCGQTDFLDHDVVARLVDERREREV